jgi:hypothetical protein
MRKRNKAKRFEKKQHDEFELLIGSPESVQGLIGSLNEDLQRVDALVADFEKELGM